MNRSPFFYVGDKYKLMNQLSELFPDNINRLIEPFCGGGSVFLNTKAKKYIANDNNFYMIQLHKFLCSFKGKREVLFEQIKDIILKYGFSASYLGIEVDRELKSKHIKTYYAVYNKESYKNLKNDFNNQKDNMIYLYLLLIYGFNHMLRFNKNGDFNLPVGNVDYNKNVVNALNNYFDHIEKNTIKFYCYDFEKFINKLEFEVDDFVYFDPPYLISGSEYNKNWTVDEEKRLLELLDKLNERGIKFALSNVLFHKGKTNEILIEWSKKYKVIDVKSNYISYHDNTNKNSKEVLIVNYE